MIHRKIPRLALALCLALAILLSACGAPATMPETASAAQTETASTVQPSRPSAAVVPQTTQSPQEQTGYAYQSDGYEILSEPADSVFFIGDRLFYVAMEDNGERAAYDMWHVTSENGALNETIRLEPEGLTDTVLFITPGNDALWYCVQTESGLSMCSVTADSGVIGRVPLADSRNLYPYSVAVDGAGCFYLLDVDTLKVYSAGGNRVADFSLSEEQGIGLTRLSGGQVLLSTRRILDGGTAEGAVKLVNTESIGASLTDRANTYRVYAGWDGLALLNDGSGLYTLNIDTGEMAAVLDWIDTYQDPSLLVSLAANSPENIYLICGGEESLYLRYLRQVPVEPESRTVVNLGYYLWSDGQASAVNSLAVAFNQSQEDVRIHIVNYNNYSDGQDRIRADAGDLDLVLTSDAYLADMDLTDLRNLMDGAVGEDTLMPCVYHSLGDGEISALPLFFQVQTMMGNRTYLGEGEGWSPAQFAEAVEEHSDAAILQYDTAYDSLATIAADAGAYVTDFASLLKAFRNVPADDETIFDLPANTSAQLIPCLRDGSLLLAPLLLSDFSDLLAWDAAMEGDLVLKGYPVDSGNGGLIVPSRLSMAGIPAASAHQQEAWEFLKRLLSDENLRQSLSGFPVLEADYAALETQAMQGITYTDGEGKTVTTGGTVFLDGVVYETEPLTETRAAWLREYLDGLSGTMGEDAELAVRAREALRSVIEEDKDPAEAARTILP